MFQESRNDKISFYAVHLICPELVGSFRLYRVQKMRNKFVRKSFSYLRANDYSFDTSQTPST